MDFFISYNKADREWAEWIAYVLEEEGFSTSVQAWDFRPGKNFVLELQRVAGSADRTIMVLSPDYLVSEFGSPEWAAAFAGDPKGDRAKLLPVMVRPCEPTGMLRQIVRIDLVGQGEENARKRLLEGVKEKRGKPDVRPAFPTRAAEDKETAPQPRQYSPRRSSSAPYIPDIRRPPTDADRRKFVKAGFATIADRFRSGLEALKSRYGEIETDIDFRGDSDFTAEVFSAGKSRCHCRIWLGGMLSKDSISYNEGRVLQNNAVNEMLSIFSDNNQLYLSATMGASFFEREGFDLKRLSPEAAADYLWRRFLEPLERA
ncbi:MULTISPECIES: toll/interleukin-1 receptor domain-containing protein [Bradyrhizobium]|uniref:toll/interleukin-1 receptor domain-containing protein n=1 Tax=Bradyrhizobium TaxID=374 RepID=UPI000D58C659|nr:MULTISPECIES: toll/interleukin-1 receptor domain-containing protein [Bradyrhizobium]UFW51111.1 toll/interleukin-1 receptor domain-containing protein [Bradyrhizobium arachidis]